MHKKLHIWFQLWFFQVKWNGGLSCEPFQIRMTSATFELFRLKLCVDVICDGTILWLICVFYMITDVILIMFYRYHGYCYILWLCLWSCGRIDQVITSAFSYCRRYDSSGASSAAECLSSVPIWVYLYHVYLHLQGDKPSCLKVIFVKIIYENFSIFSWKLWLKNTHRHLRLRLQVLICINTAVCSSEWVRRSI